MKRKLLFGILLLFISLVNPGCKHDAPDAKKMYLKYLHSRLKK
jgi:hypothetical protein